MGSAAGKTANRKLGIFERFSMRISKATGTTAAFISAATLILVWLLAGPFFDFSPTWQLIINTGTTIITFLMVFVIQRAQMKDSLALHLKLNELVAAYELASNRLINAEDFTEDELKLLHTYYQKLAEMARSSINLQESHSIEEAEAWHHKKKAHHEARRKKNPVSKREENNDSLSGEHIISSSE